MQSSTLPQQQQFIGEASQPKTIVELSSDASPKETSFQCGDPRFSSNYFAVKEVANGWATSLEGQNLGVFESAYEAADHVNFELDMLKADARSRKGYQYMTTYNKLNVIEGEELLRGCRNLSRENSFVTTKNGTGLGDDCKIFQSYEISSSTPRENQNAHKFDGQEWDVTQRLAAKINPATLLSSGEAPSIWPPLRKPSEDVLNSYSEKENIAPTQVHSLKTRNGLLRKKIVENDDKPMHVQKKQNYNILQGYILNDGAEFQPFKNKGNSFNYTEREEHNLESEGNQKKDALWDDIVKEMPPLSDYTETQLIRPEYARQHKRKLAIVAKRREKEAHIDDIKYPPLLKTRAEAKDRTKIEMKTQAALADMKVVENVMNQSDCDDSRKAKRKRRKKGPNSPYQINSSKFYGVCRHKNGVRKKWVAKCGSKYIGYFFTEHEAAAAVDKQLDDMGVDRRFRNIGGSETALKIMKTGTRQTNWRRPLAEKIKLGESEDLSLKNSPMKPTKPPDRIKAKKDLKKLLDFDGAQQNVGNDCTAPLELLSQSQIGPKPEEFPKVESRNQSDMAVNEADAPITTVALRSETPENPLAEIPTNFQRQLMLNHPVSYLVNPMRMLLLWRSRSLLSTREYVTAVSMLDGRYGEVNAWSTKGLLDIGDIDTLKAALHEAE